MSWFDEMCKTMAARHGERGWKRRLAEMLGVSDSNVQNWIRAGDAPAIVRTAFEAMEEVRCFEVKFGEIENDNFAIEEVSGSSGFRTLACDDKSGHFIEIATTQDLELARAVVQVASGALDRKIAAVVDMCDILMPDECDQILVRNLTNWNEETRRERKARRAKDANMFADSLLSELEEGGATK